MLPICYSLSQEYILEELAHHLQRIVIFQRMRCPQQSSFQLYSWGNGDKWGSNLPKYTQLLSGESEIAQLCPTLCDPWTIAHQAPPSMGFSRQEYWSGLPFPSPDMGKVCGKVLLPREGLTVLSGLCEWLVLKSQMDMWKFRVQIRFLFKEVKSGWKAKPGGC